MKLITIKNAFILALLILFFDFNSHAQRITEIGLSTGAIRFYPEAQYLGANRNNSMDNGWGFSAGIFAEDHWKPKIHQVVEVNYYNLSSDVFLQKNPNGPWAPYDGTGRQPVYKNFQNTSFDQVAISGGIKYFLNKKLFLYPAFEVARSLNSSVDVNKTTYHLKLGAGIDLNTFKVGLEYAYGLNHQRKIYDYTIPFAGTHRNKYLQLKVHIPLYSF